MRDYVKGIVSNQKLEDLMEKRMRVNTGLSTECTKYVNQDKSKGGWVGYFYRYVVKSYILM